MVRNNSLPDSAGFLIRFGCRFTASRANSASPQTVPLVAVANPNLIDGICAGICSILLFISSLKQFHQCSIFSVVAFCFYIYLILLPSTPKRLTRFACHISAQVRCVGITACPSCGFAATGDKVRCKMG